MSKNIDLIKILKDCPKGTVLWSDIYGEVKFLGIDTSIQHPIKTRRADGANIYYTKEGWFSTTFPASCLLWPSKDQRNWNKFTASWYKKDKLVKPKFKVGDRIRHKETNKDDVYEISKVYDDSYGITGFTWMIYMKYQDKYELIPNKFDPKTLQPFDKVLVRDSSNAVWSCKWFSHIMDLSKFYKYATTGCLYRYCIPYNDDTKHLVGTTDDAPDYYKYWED